MSLFYQFHWVYLLTFTVLTLFPGAHDFHGFIPHQLGLKRFSYFHHDTWKILKSLLIPLFSGLRINVNAKWNYFLQWDLKNSGFQFL